MSKKILLFPKGTHKINSEFREGDAIILKVKINKETADSLNCSLDRLSKEKPQNIPFIAQDASCSKASGFIKGFCYDKTRGVLAICEFIKSRKGQFLTCANFTVNANFKKVLKKNGVYQFKKNQIGGENNPAEITGTTLCVAFWDKNPAFKKLMKL